MPGQSEDPRGDKRTVRSVRPWGEIHMVVRNQACSVDLTHVKQGQRASLHSHRVRTELFHFLDDGAYLEVDGRVLRPKAHEEHVIHPGVKHRFWAEENRTPFAILFDHEPIGFCLAEDTSTSYKINDFYVRPLHRRRGFGSAAVERVKEHFRGIGRHAILAANVYVNNAPAIEFWQSAGFRDTGRRVRIRQLRLIEMECELDD